MINLIQPFSIGLIGGYMIFTFWRLFIVSSNKLPSIAFDISAAVGITYLTIHKLDVSVLLAYLGGSLLARVIIKVASSKKVQ